MRADTIAVIASGHSLTPDMVETAHQFKCVVINDVYKLAPWAWALVANDLKWWHENPEALAFAGNKYSTAWMPGVSRLDPNGSIYTSTNSGLVGIHVAAEQRPKRILLLGFDMNGDHYFGKHERLANTTDSRFSEFRWQCTQYARKVHDIAIINCTPGSALTCFPSADLKDFDELVRV